jgi:hypothetical protein
MHAHSNVISAARLSFVHVLNVCLTSDKLGSAITMFFDLIDLAINHAVKLLPVPHGMISFPLELPSAEKCFFAASTASA